MVIEENEIEERVAGTIMLGLFSNIGLPESKGPAEVTASMQSLLSSPVDDQQANGRREREELRIAYLPRKYPEESIMAEYSR